MGAAPGVLARARGRKHAISSAGRAWPVPIAIQHLFAFVGYWLIVLALLSPKVRGQLGTRLLSSTPADASFFVWALRWWPHALVGGLQPIFTTAVYAPSGFNLAWATSIPLPSVVIAPVTLAFGPFVAFNVVALLAPATAAWTAYLLCRRVTGRGLASFAGGFFFGFSTYEALVVSAGHLNLSLVLMLPLCAYLLARRLERSLGDRAFVLWLAGALVAQALISTEVLATLTVAAAITIALGLLLAPADRRAIARTAGLAALAVAVAAVMLAPFLYVAFAYPIPSKPYLATAASARHAADVLSGLVVPGRMTWFGHGWPFHANASKNANYLGIPLALILVLVAIMRWRSAAVRTLTAAFGVILLLSFGSYLRIGSVSVPLPWNLIARMPLLHRAGAGRLIVFASLIVALAVATWAALPGRRWLRWAIVVVAGTAIVPNVGANMWASNVTLPAFITSRAYARYLEPGETVVVIAPGRQHQMYWQAASNMYFRLAGGYMGTTPPDFPHVAFARRLVGGVIEPSEGPMLRRFVAEHHVGALLVLPDAFPWAEDALRHLIGPPIRVGGVLLYQIPPGWSSEGAPTPAP
jgi:hypothetical protein